MSPLLFTMNQLSLCHAEEKYGISKQFFDDKKTGNFI